MRLTRNNALGRGSSHSTVDDVSANRLRAWLNSHNSVVRYGAASGVARASSILTALLLTPLAIDRLGVTGYSIWVLALTVPNFVASPDLGISQGLVNRLSEAHLRDGSLVAEHGRLRDLTRLLASLASSGSFWGQL